MIFNIGASERAGKDKFRYAARGTCGCVTDRARAQLDMPSPCWFKSTSLCYPANTLTLQELEDLLHSSKPQIVQSLSRHSPMQAVRLMRQ